MRYLVELKRYYAKWVKVEALDQFSARAWDKWVYFHIFIASVAVVVSSSSIYHCYCMYCDFSHFDLCYVIVDILSFWLCTHVQK